MDNPHFRTLVVLVDEAWSDHAIGDYFCERGVSAPSWTFEPHPRDALLSALLKNEPDAVIFLEQDGPVVILNQKRVFMSGGYLSSLANAVMRCWEGLRKPEPDC